MVPRADGRLIVGATVEERGFDTAVTAGGVHELLREAYRALPEIAELELERDVAGLRPGTPDNAPLIGPGAADGLLLATGHFRNGILLAPADRRVRRRAARGRGAVDPTRAPERRADTGRFAAGGGRDDGRAERRAVELPDEATVADAVARSGPSADGGAGVAVAVDGEVVPRRRVGPRRELREGQNVEVVRAVQGG